MITPILHRVILKPDPIEEVTAAGIVICKDLIKKERKAIETATVVSIGETAFKDYGGGVTTIKVGDRVVIAQYSGKEIKDADGEIYLAVNDEDIIATLGE